MQYYSLPRDAAAYIDAVNEAYDAEPCEHGHFGCALFNGGPCSDEAASRQPVNLYGANVHMGLTWPDER